MPEFGKDEGHPADPGGAAGSEAALCLQGSQQNSVNVHTTYNCVVQGAALCLPINFVPDALK